MKNNNNNQSKRHRRLLYNKHKKRPYIIFKGKRIYVESSNKKLIRHILNNYFLKTKRKPIKIDAEKNTKEFLKENIKKVLYGVDDKDDFNGPIQELRDKAKTIKLDATETQYQKEERLKKEKKHLEEIEKLNDILKKKDIKYKEKINNFFDKIKVKDNEYKHFIINGVENNLNQMDKEELKNVLQINNTNSKTQINKQKNLFIKRLKKKDTFIDTYNKYIENVTSNINKFQTFDNVLYNKKDNYVPVEVLLNKYDKMNAYAIIKESNEEDENQFKNITQEIEEEEKIFKPKNKTQTHSNTQFEDIPEEEEQQSIFFKSKRQNQYENDSDNSGGGKKNGLYNTQIDGIMRPFRDKYNYIGTFPLDYLNDVVRYIKKNKLKQFSFILNTETLDSKYNGHWIAIYCDCINDMSFEIYDPLAQKRKILYKRIHDLFTNLFNDMEIKTYLKFKSNTIRQQSFNSSNCGWYAIRFLIMRYQNISFKKATFYKGIDNNENNIESLKNSYNKFGYI